MYFMIPLMVKFVNRRGAPGEVYCYYYAIYSVVNINTTLYLRNKGFFDKKCDCRQKNPQNSLPIYIWGFIVLHKHYICRPKQNRHCARRTCRTLHERFSCTPKHHGRCVGYIK